MTQKMGENLWLIQVGMRQGSKPRSHASREAADIANAVEPRTESAYYDQSRDRVVINLKSGATFSFPPALAQGLADASPEDLAEVEVTPSGDGLHDREAGWGF